MFEVLLFDAVAGEGFLVKQGFHHIMSNHPHQFTAVFLFKVGEVAIQSEFFRIKELINFGLGGVFIAYFMEVEKVFPRNTVIYMHRI